jgi:hypothetical protein
MGFHKRFVTRDLIMGCKSFEEIEDLLNADALILDSWSSNFVERLDRNHKEYQQKRLERIEESKLSSSFPNTDTFDKLHLSNILMNLKNDPNWLDIQLCIESFRPIDIPITIAGKFDLMCNFCLHLIETEFEK